MLSVHEIDTFLQHTPAPLQDIVWELRNIIASVTSDAVEVIRWGGLSYFHEGRGGIVSASICQIGILADHVQLAFIHGIHLSDPRQMLEGSQKVKRFIRIRSYDDAPWDYLTQMIEESARFDPRSHQLQTRELH